MRRLDGLQHLRAVAALGVVAFHAGARYGLHQPIGPWAVDFWGLGERGVDIFFVLSGFLLWTTTSARPPKGPLPFLWSRFKRLAPPYWLATGVLALAALFTGLYPHLVVQPLHVLSSLFFWPMASPSHPPAIWPLLVPGWTLNYEMAFYVLFAATLLVPATRRLLVLAAAVAALLLVGLIPVLPVPVDFWTRPLIVEFLFGVGVGAVWTSGRRHGVAVAAVLLSMGALALVFAPWAAHRSLMSGVPAALVVLGLATLDERARWPRLPLLTWLGDASYSIFLWHTIGITVTYQLVKPHHLDPVPATLICAAVGVALGLVGYVLIEKPIAARLSVKRTPPAP